MQNFNSRILAASSICFKRKSAAIIRVAIAKFELLFTETTYDAARCQVLVLPFIYIYARAFLLLARLHRPKGSPETSMVTLCDKYLFQ